MNHHCNFCLLTFDDLRENHTLLVLAGLLTVEKKSVCLQTIVTYIHYRHIL